MDTTHLHVRPLRLEDTSPLFRLTSDPAVTRYMRFSAHMAPRETETLIRSYSAPGCAGFALTERSTGRFVGMIGLKPEEGTGSYRVSFLLGPAFWGRGYATQALHAVVGYAQTVLFARTLSAYVVGENQSSRRVPAKCGFLQEEQRSYNDLPDGLCVYRMRLSGGEREFPHV